MSLYKKIFRHSGFGLGVFLLAPLMSCSLIACTSKPAVDLRWDVQAHSVYRITNQSFPREMDVDVDAMLANPALLQVKIDELKSLPLDPRYFPMQLKMDPDAHGKISLLAENVHINYHEPAGDENEKRRREMQEAAVGVVQLNTTINQFGVNQNLFTKSLQNNLVSLMFRLPEHPASVGEHWQIPVVLSSLNTPFLADHTHRDNKVWINTVREEPGGGRVAEIVYLLQEDISGQRQQFTTEPATPFKVTSNYFAVGEYQIERHKWLSYVGRLDAAVGILRTVSLIALAPVDSSDKAGK